MKTRSLFIVAAVLEGAIGLALLVVPAEVVRILLGTAFEAPAGSVVARVAGAALLALALANWHARRSEPSAAATGIVAAMFFYNAAAAVVLAYAGIGLHLYSIALWPTVVLHLAMAVWCLGCLLGKGR